MLKPNLQKRLFISIYCCEKSGSVLPEGETEAAAEPQMGYAVPRECIKEMLLLGMRSLGAHLLWEGSSAAPQKPQPLFQPIFPHCCWWGSGWFRE